METVNSYILTRELFSSEERLVFFEILDFIFPRDISFIIYDYISKKSMYVNTFENCPTGNTKYTLQQNTLLSLYTTNNTCILFKQDLFTKKITTMNFSKVHRTLRSFSFFNLMFWVSYNQCDLYPAFDAIDLFGSTLIHSAHCVYNMHLYVTSRYNWRIDYDCSNPSYLKAVSMSKRHYNNNKSHTFELTLIVLYNNDTPILNNDTSPSNIYVQHISVHRNDILVCTNYTISFFKNGRSNEKIIRLDLKNSIVLMHNTHDGLNFGGNLPVTCIHKKNDQVCNKKTDYYRYHVGVGGGFDVGYITDKDICVCAYSTSGIYTIFTFDRFSLEPVHRYCLGPISRKSVQIVDNWIIITDNDTKHVYTRY